MKIALIGQKGLPAWSGGVERHVEELAPRLALLGHAVTVFGRRWFTKMEDGIVNGVFLVHAPTIATKHLDTITHTFFASLKAIQGRYDIIHYHGVGPALLAFLPRIFSRHSRVIVTFHSIDRYHRKWGAFAKFALRVGEWCACKFSHQTITISESLQEYCRNEFGVETIYIPNGVSIKNEKADPKYLELHSLVPKEYLAVITRLVPHKAVHVAISSFVQLKNSFPADEKIKKLKLAIVGGSAHTDNYVRELKKQAEGRDDIIFTGNQSGESLRALYQNALGLVHPSFNEGLPTTVIEAMASGTPTLLSHIPEHRELVSDERLFYAVNDVGALTERLHVFLNLTDAARAEIIATNLKTVKEKYDWDELVKKVEKVYRK